MRTLSQDGSVRLKNGRYYGSFRGLPDATGKRKRESVALGPKSEFPTKAKAKEKLREEIAEYYQRAAGRLVTPEMSLRQFAEGAYWEAHETDWSANSRRNLRCVLEKHILKPMGDKPLSGIVKADVVQRITEMRLAGYGKQTLKLTKWLLHSIFEEAIDNDLLSKNPTRKYRLKNIPDPAETKPLTEDEVRKVYAVLTGRERLMWRLMLACGLRPGEMLALRRNDFSGDTLRVDEAWECMEFKPPKNGKTRYAPIPASLKREVDAYLSTIEKRAGALLFAGKLGHPPSSGSFSKYIVAKAKEATGIKDLMPRRCRATFATMIEGDIKDIQDLLGHSDVAITMKHYKKAIPERQREASEALDRALTEPRLAVVSKGGKR